MLKSAQNISSPLLTEKEAAFYLTRSVSSLRRDRKNGVGPRYVRLGRSVRYPKVELDAYLCSRMNARVPGVSNA
jgi:predicted DNA-binding transcriptional regulator AlpA